jgi:hypothetical protein
MSFLQAGLNDGQVPQDDIVQFSESLVPCSQLRPTQNEIDIDKSLSYPLTKESSGTLLNYFQGGTFAPGGKIVTSFRSKIVFF